MRGRCTLHRERTNWRARSSSTSKTWALFKKRTGHVELHVLDLPITQAAHQVVDLYPSDLPMSDEDIPQCWVVNEGVPFTRPPLDSTFRTSHPRPHAILLPFSPLTSEASIRQMTPSPKVHLESSAGHGGATS